MPGKWLEGLEHLLREAPGSPLLTQAVGRKSARATQRHHTGLHKHRPMPQMQPWSPLVSTELSSSSGLYSLHDTINPSSRASHSCRISHVFPQFEDCECSLSLAPCLRGSLKVYFCPPQESRCAEAGWLARWGRGHTLLRISPPW